MLFVILNLLVIFTYIKHRIKDIIAKTQNYSRADVTRKPHKKKPENVSPALNTFIFSFLFYQKHFTGFRK